MNTQATSTEAYKYASRTLGKRQQEVLECIRKYGPVTNYDIARILMKEINTITPRVKELRDKVLVEQAGSKITNTGRRSITWQVVYTKELF